MNRFVIYRIGKRWEGAVEYPMGRWPFKRVQHAPVTHAATAEAVFAWLLERYPDREICLDPAVTERYKDLS